MQRRTTTQQLQNAITNNLLIITKAECHYKSSSRIDEISSDTFLENLQFLCEAGVFADTIGWHFEKDYRSGTYILETGRLNPHSEIIIAVYLDVCNGISDSEISEALLFQED